ncbi:N-acetyltransferase family protein [Pleomorphomonas sp. PLEO]|uniref:GNAT family N-acetyltransferase n=1 Tax=Pleomorphomonas sp. PLEO TaxID=3239306 RepID=UPI00351DD74A
MLDIHPARVADQGKIVQLWHRGWHEAHAALVPPEGLSFRTEGHFAIWLKEAKDAFYVARDGTELIGFVSVKAAEVVKLYVGTSARGTGTAHALLSFAEQLLFADGVSEAELLCTAGNSRAERFYQREGWHLTDTFDDALWMPKGVSRQFIVATHRFQKTLIPAT